MFGTPDYGHSDLWHLNFSLKFLLAKTLKEGYFPLWSKDIGTGFPLAGEGQIGMFHLPNIILLRFFDPVTAFNLGLGMIFLLTFCGTYLFGRSLRFSRLASVFFAGIFSFSGCFVTHITHFNLIQTAALLPWLFFLTEKFLQTTSKWWLALLSLAVSQQITAGFPQLTLISAIGVTIYAVMRIKCFIPLVKIGSFFLLGVILSAPQFLTTLQLVKLSFRSGGISLTETVRFPFNPIHLFSFFHPYLFGDPRKGTYPPFGIDWGIFWESTGYLGIVPVILAIITLIFRRKLPLVKIFALIAVISLILLLGKYTPFFFVFQIPPLSFFRVPARFLFLFVWAIALLATISLDRVKNLPLKVFLVVISLLNISYFALTYNAWIKNPQEWLAVPQTAQIIKQDQSWFRIYGLKPINAWNRIFLSEGWQNIEKYFPFRNALDANQNLLWGLSSIDYYHTGLASRRQQLWTQIFSIYDEETTTAKTNEIFLNKSTRKILSLAGVKYLISPLPIRSDETDLLLTATVSGQPNFYIYQNPKAYPHAYLTTNYVVAKNIPDLLSKLTDASSSAAVLEKPVEIIPSESTVGTAEVIKNEDLEILIKVSATAKALLILSDSYYPGWEAYLDGRRTEILPVNLNQRAVIVPEGLHEINFYYRPFSSENILSLFRR